ncbi:MAG: DUF1566 domain-containing protein [Deltaproteobacteria bacterium]|nr:DUF1566 domain-containing protein [Deltaproteobacteria bacterium]
MKKSCLFLIAALVFCLTTLHAFEPQKKTVTLPKTKAKINRISKDKLEPYVPMNINGDKVVKDNINKLMWEVKSSKDSNSNYGNPNDADNTYAWYDPNPATNGTAEGLSRNSSDFLTAMNSRHYAGYSDWRMPTLDELKTLIIESDNHTHIDTNLFPNTIFLKNNNLQYYWTSTDYDYCSQPGICIWAVTFRTGHTIGNHSKVLKHHIRAVRDLK